MFFGAVKNLNNELTFRKTGGFQYSKDVSENRDKLKQKMKKYRTRRVPN